MKRSKRPYGVRVQDWQAIRNFEREKKTNPYIPDGKTIWVRPPCRCAKWPFAHYHDNLPMEAAKNPFEPPVQPQPVPKKPKPKPPASPIRLPVPTKT